MNDPEREISAIVYRLTATNVPDVQKATIEKYMTPDVLGVFQWYRVLSPTVDIRVDSVVYDQPRDVMYLEITQWFKLFFLPRFMVPAPASLLTRLKLVKVNDLYYIAEQHDFYPRDDFAALLLPASVPFVRAALSLAGSFCNVGATVAGYFGYWSPSARPTTTEPGLYSDRED